MRTLLLLILLTASAKAQQHCGYDFTSYIVLHIHEDGKTQSIPNLKVTLVDSTGNTAINVDNKYSWNKSGEILMFWENYKIDSNNKRLLANINDEKARWFFPHAKDTYLLSVTNEFPADQMHVKVEDPTGKYKQTIVQLYSYNMYVLCTSQVEKNAIQFGRKMNKPINVVLEKTE